MTTLALRRVASPVLGRSSASGIAAWLIAWILLAPAVDWLTTDVLGLDTSEGFGAAFAFFLFDLPKVMLLLVGRRHARELPALVRVTRPRPADAGRPQRRGRRHRGRPVRGRHAVLLLLGGAALHRLRGGRACRSA